MKIVFRADASLQIGTGHVMRCLTLADALHKKGAECVFICREAQGNLIEQIRRKGYSVHELPIVPQVNNLNDDVGAEASLAHAHWLDVTQEQDAAVCARFLEGLHPDWLIVDHYALDARWEKVLKPHCRQLMVIDDLADRLHLCDLLLDQTFARDAEDYKAWVPVDCTLLCGSQYALLRSEFSALRSYSLERRGKSPKLERLLISMGGVDNDNATGQVLQALEFSELSASCHITVVMGATAPWLADVRRQAVEMTLATTVLVGVSNMAQLMADSDFAIGAAGATSWERCCLGVPTIMLVLADNQRQVARGLELAGAVSVLQGAQQMIERLPRLLRSLISSSTQREAMSLAASRVVDGRGVDNVIHHLER